MYQQKFVDRNDALAFLEERYKSNSPEMAVLYGRRRVGKTELMLKFLENKKGIYFLASTEGDRQNIRDFSRIAGRFINDENFSRLDFPDWHIFFETLIKHAAFSETMKKEKIVIVMDEFPFLIQSNRAIPSIFQKIWELAMKKENIMLVLSGSAIGIMESEVLGVKSPLYGRRTGQWQLHPLDFIYLKGFLPYSMEQLAMTWFAVGGIPAYLLKFAPKISFWENISNNVIKKGSYLYMEAEMLLNDEFREPKNYKLIFKAVALGCNTLGEIYNYTGFDKSMVSKYLEVLKKLHIIKEEIPVTASEKFKRRLYFISDPYFNFWFRFVYPNKIDLEAGRNEEILFLIKKDFPEYSGHMFEFLVEEMIRNKHILDEFSFSKIGRWWHKDMEIDIVALNERTKEILFCECKWQNKKTDVSVLADLKEKAKYVIWNNESRKERFVVVSKSGFTKDAESFAKENGFLLFDLNDLEKLLSK